MDKRSILVVSGAMMSDPSWNRVAQYAHRNHSAWCEMNKGIAIMSDFEQNIPGTRPVSWRKLSELRLFSRRSETVVWMDADCLFRDGATLYDFTADPARIRFASDLNGINCGCMIVPPSAPWVDQFLSMWFDAATPTEINDPWWEQRTLHRMVRELPSVAARIGEPIPSRLLIHAAGIPSACKLDWLVKKTKEQTCQT